MIKRFIRTGMFKICTSVGLCMALTTCSIVSPLLEVEQESHKELVERILSRPQPRFPTTVYNPDSDPVAQLYRNDRTSKQVMEFFLDLTGSERVTQAILDNSIEQGVPIPLAFALAWMESRYKTSLSSTNKNRSVDRGLFQLNSSSFPHLSHAEVFDPHVNAKNGLAYLRFCLSYSGNEVAALAMYNAGLPRVAKARTPASTYIYIEKILAKRDEIVLRLDDSIASL